MPTSLLLTAAPVVSMEQVNALLEAQGLSAADPAAVATGSGALMPGALSAGAYDVAVLVASAPGHHTVSLLGQLSAALKPGGRLVVQEVRRGAEGGARRSVPGWLVPAAASCPSLTPSHACPRCPPSPAWHQRG